MVAASNRQGPGAAQEGQVEGVLTVVDMAGGSSRLDVSFAPTVASVKAYLENEAHIPAEEQHLYFETNEVYDHQVCPAGQALLVRQPANLRLGFPDFWPKLQALEEGSPDERVEQEVATALGTKWKYEASGHGDRTGWRTDSLFQFGQFKFQKSYYFDDPGAGPAIFNHHLTITDMESSRILLEATYHSDPAVTLRIWSRNKPRLCVGSFKLVAEELGRVALNEGVTLQSFLRKTPLKIPMNNDELCAFLQHDVDCVG